MVINKISIIAKQMTEKDSAHYRCSGTRPYVRKHAVLIRKSKLFILIKPLSPILNIFHYKDGIF